MSKSSTLNKIFKVAAGVAMVAVGIIQVFNRKNEDLGCDWVCDNCGADLNTQPGFRAGYTWVCTSCGYENDVSAENIIPSKRLLDDRGAELDILETPTPWYDTDPEDY